MMKLLRGEITSGKLLFMNGGVLIGGGLVVTNWTHVVYFQPVGVLLGVAVLLLAWRIR